MGIVGDHPEEGIRFDLERTTAAAPWVYVGSAFTNDVEHRVEASVDAAGAVAIVDEATLPKEVAQRVTMLLRTTWKRAVSERADAPLPRRLHRWRAG
jgi:hypothetical protein